MWLGGVPLTDLEHVGTPSPEVRLADHEYMQVRSVVLRNGGEGMCTCSRLGSHYTSYTNCELVVLVL